MTAPIPAPSSLGSRAADLWRDASTAFVRGFHAYGTWLAGISWRRFIVLAAGFFVCVGILSTLPPFSWTYTETLVSYPATSERPEPSQKPKTPRPPAPPRIEIEKGAGESGAGDADGMDIRIGADGIHIRKGGSANRAASPTAPAASGASAPEPASASSAPGLDVSADGDGVHIVLPPGASSETVRQAVQEAKRAVSQAIEEARHDEEDAQAEVASDSSTDDNADTSTVGHKRVSKRTVSYGDSIPGMAMVWIMASAILKATYKGRLQAEVKAAQAEETAEAESLKRQVVEARMAAMQAQVEPHFLFNTLASIDHLIETDPPRASQMQKNLIALLRASMPTMRDTSDAAARDLGRELAMVRPYVEILKVRMEERLDARIDVPDGLLSAEFPSMMIQTLVENAIRHGLEPKPEGGRLRVKAEIVHGKLAVTVADTGVGFGNAATAGSGVGLANIRERLKLLHGSQASLTITANEPTGTVVTVTVPYRAVAASTPASKAGDTV